MLLAALVLMTGCQDRAGASEIVVEPRPAASLAAWSPHAVALWQTPPEPEPARVLLETDPFGAAEANLIGGWSLPPAAPPGPGVWSLGQSSLVRFELERVQPLWLDLRASPFRWVGAPRAVLRATANGHALPPLELADGFHDYRVGLPGEVLQSGTNLLRFDYDVVGVPAERLPESRDKRELGVAFHRIALVPHGVLRPVEATLAGKDAPTPGWLQAVDGSASFLVAVPEEARLELGGAPTGASGPHPLHVRVEAQTDAGLEVLWERETPADAPVAWHTLDLGAFAGQAVRLRLVVRGLVADGAWLWLEPRIRSRQSTPGERFGPVLQGANLVVVVVDAAARARFGLYGGNPENTPTLDALAGESLVFDNAHSQAAYTLASTASLFTSLHPARHRVVRKSHKLSASLPTLASALTGAGYETIAFSGNGFAGPSFGMDSGFATFHMVGGAHRPGHVAHPSDIWTGFESWLADRTSQRPFFAYLHYLQPHEPYNVAPASYYDDAEGYEGWLDGSDASMTRLRRGEAVPEPHDVEHLNRLYEGNLRYVDDALGTLLEHLRDTGLIEETILVVTSDHGEALGEGGFFGHNYSLQEEVTAIPLLLRLPRSVDLTGRVAVPAASVDIAPTVLAALGVDAPAGFEGHDLLERPPELANPYRVVFSRSAHDQSASALWFGSFKYEHAPGRGGRTLRRRPAWDAGPNLVTAHPVTFALLDRTREAFLRPPRTSGAPERAVLSDDARAALEALGYVFE